MFKLVDFKGKFSSGWKHLFVQTGMSCVVFTVSLMEYDAYYSFKGKSSQETTDIFNAFVHISEFESVPIILLFTKKGMQTNL